MTHAQLPRVGEILRRHGLSDTDSEPFPNDGWSGAEMRLLTRDDGERFVLKRDSPAGDWIARSTADGPILREAWFAAAGPPLPAPVRAPYLAVGRDADEFGILMPDLSGVLFDWNATVTPTELDRVLRAIASLHAFPWGERLGDGGDHWTPWRERLTLISRPALERPGPAHDAVADRILPGWDAWDRQASPEAKSLIADLANEPEPLLNALAREPATLLHGDLKLANVGLAADGAVEIVDWQMVMAAPIAIELGWFLVANVNALPLPAADALERYASILEDVLAQTTEGAARRRSVDGRSDGPGTHPYDSWPRQAALATIVGLLLRGWRKGYDVEAGIALASGLSAREDLRWWCERAVEASSWLD